ncbi:MAG: Flp pilus assembly complex ATPase component TadA [Treponema sp.]|nr:Flp pilus assembly complex ATPase component TadA [Treponema sp.]
MNKYNFQLNPAYCLFNGVAVLNQKGSEISFMMEDLKNEELKKSLQRAFNSYLENIKKSKDCPPYFCGEAKLKYFEGKRQEIKNCVSQMFEKENAGGDFSKGEEIGASEDKKEGELDAAAVILLDSLIFEAIKKGASDIHMEKGQIKFRVNGKLEEEMTLSDERFYQVLLRIKVLSGMNVLESCRSQDGHFVFTEDNGNSVFIRTSTLPIIGKNYEEGHESVVLRILDKERLPLKLDRLGFNDLQLSLIEDLLEEKNGLILVCGPTGAGKSTSIASMLKELQERKSGQLKIISLEDPPEYILEGITQVKVNDVKNNSFENLLNHIFRQDPDVLMIGEIRDEVTAAVALRASLTGHLVLATLHTASAAEAFLRLENLGVNRKLLASILRGVLIQELSYLGNEVSLIADLSLPQKDLDRKIDESMGQSKLDECFEHFVNGKEVLRKSLQILSEKMKMKDEENLSFAGQLDESKRKKLLPLIKSKKKVIGEKKA